jgi:hypothetical protein
MFILLQFSKKPQHDHQYGSLRPTFHNESLATLGPPCPQSPQKYNHYHSPAKKSTPNNIINKKEN